MKTSIIIVRSIVFLSSAIRCSDLASSSRVITSGGYYEMQEPRTLYYGIPSSEKAVIQIMPHHDYYGDPKMFTIRCSFYNAFAHKEYDVEVSKTKCSLTSGPFSFNFGPQSSVVRESHERALQAAKVSWAARTATLRKQFQTTRIPDSPEVTAELFRSKLIVVHGSSHVAVHPCTFVEQEEDPCSVCSIS